MYIFETPNPVVFYDLRREIQIIVHVLVTLKTPYKKFFISKQPSNITPIIAYGKRYPTYSGERPRVEYTKSFLIKHNIYLFA